MKLWIDDVRPAPPGYVWLKTVNDAIRYIEIYGDYLDFDNNLVDMIEMVDIDHDAGSYACYGGDYIKLLDWLEAPGRSYPIHIHSMNVVGRMNMEAICKRNGWTILP